MKRLLPLLLLLAGCSFNSSKIVRPAATPPLEEKFQLEVVNIGLEKLGYQVQPGGELEPATAHIAIANGDLDYTTLHYEILHNKFFVNAGGEQKMQRVGTIIADVFQGYQIDKATANRHNITNIEQLKDPEIARLFDSDGDGKANLVGCNPGWGCELTIEHHLDAYGLRDTVEVDKGKYSVLIADAVTRYEQGQPVFYFAWIPFWLSAVLKPDQDTIWLEVPYTDFPQEQGSFTEKDTSVDGKNLGFPVGDIKIVANNEFLDKNPVAKRFFQLVRIPVEDISRQNQLIRNGDDNVRRHAEEWVQNNQKLFDDWIAEAKKAAN